jgi:soluble lytic murein transglycosylase-like protein
MKSAWIICLSVVTLCGVKKVDASDAIYITLSKSGRPVYTSVPLNSASRIFLNVIPTSRQVDSIVPVLFRAIPDSESAFTTTPKTIAKKSGVREVAFLSTVEKIANEYGINPALVMAVITVESRFNTNALSNKGAGGLMQLMPGTARRYGVINVFDAEQNIRGGVRYLNDLAVMFNNDLDLILAAYNAGENAVLRYKNAIPPYKETINYVKQVRHYFALGVGDR